MKEEVFPTKTLPTVVPKSERGSNKSFDGHFLILSAGNLPSLAISVESPSANKQYQLSGSAHQRLRSAIKIM